MPRNVGSGGTSVPGSQIFYVKIISVTRARGIICDKCGHTEVLEKDAFKELEAQQRAKFKAGEIPDDVVRSDYNPKKLKLWLLWTLHIPALLWALCTFISLFAIPADMKASGVGIVGILVMMLLMLAMGFVPYIASLFSLIRAKHKKKLYQAVIDWEKNPASHADSALRKETAEPSVRAQTDSTYGAAMPQDYDPKKLHLGLKRFLHILALLFAVIVLIFASAALSSMLEEHAAVGSIVIMLVFFLALGLVPYIFSLKSLIKAKRMKKQYQAAMQKRYGWNAGDPNL